MLYGSDLVRLRLVINIMVLPMRLNLNNVQGHLESPENPVLEQQGREVHSFAN